MLSSVLPTKLMPPQTRPGLVPRSRLIQQLESGLYRKLALVSAPAGFGKTTLVAEWVVGTPPEFPEACEVGIAWFSLDEADNDSNRFLTYFTSALLQSGCVDHDCGKVLLDMLQSPNLPPMETFFSPLITTLSSTAKKIILIFDDYHLIEDLHIHKTMEFWLENSPPAVHNVIISREDPPFPLARLRAQDQLTEIRAAALRFTEQEAALFLNEVMGLHLDAQSIRILEERTEGWIAGLQMAALSMQDRQDVDGFLQSFAGTNRFILDYLMEEVLANQPPQVQEFLLRTSILRRMSASLCDALIGKENESDSMLKYLERSNLFLIPLDNERRWFRYHHLFRDLLNARLMHDCTEEEKSDLHASAAQWYEENGMAYGAIFHASLIPDDMWVERIIDQNYMDVFQRKDSVSLRNWTGELGKELIFRRPQLAIHEANSRAWFGQLDQAEYLLQEAEARLQGQVSTSDTRAMHGYLAYVKGRVTAMRGNYARSIQLCRLAREETPGSNQGLLGGIGVMLGYGYFLNGEFDRAAQTLKETIQAGKKSGAINTTIGAYCVLARLCVIRGQLQQAYAFYKEAEHFIQHSDGEHRGAMSIVDVGYADVLYEWNKLDEAFARVQQGFEFLPLWSKADDFVLAYQIHARIHQARGDFPYAAQSVGKGIQVVQSSGMFSEAADAITAAQVELWLIGKDNLAINRWIGSLADRLEPDQPCRFENELILMTYARVLISHKKSDQAMDLLGRLESSARANCRNGRLLGIQILQALLAFETGSLEQAFPFLERALAAAEPEGYVRTFVDEGLLMHELLKSWAARAEAGSLKYYASHLLSQFSVQHLSGTDRIKNKDFHNIPVEQLTPRELEVLALLAMGRTNKEISVELVVSPGTIKAHTSNIYRKLDVSNRTEAVSRARELEILS